MKNLILVLLMAFGFSAFAEKVNCKVKGPHCDGCKEMIEGQVCDEAKYSGCTVKIVDAKKKMAEVELSTTDAKTKVDQKALAQIMEKMDYKLESCKQI